MAISLHMERKSPGYETYHCDLYLFRYIIASYWRIILKYDIHPWNIPKVLNIKSLYREI